MSPLGTEQHSVSHTAFTHYYHSFSVFFSADEPCVDHFSWCHLVPQHGVCNHKFYGQQCCKSCSSGRLWDLSMPRPSVAFNATKAIWWIFFSQHAQLWFGSVFSSWTTWLMNLESGRKRETTNSPCESTPCGWWCSSAKERKSSFHQSHCNWKELWM